MARHATLEESLSDINRLGMTNSEKVDPQTPAYQGFHFSALSFLREVPWALYLHLHVCHQVLNLTCFGLDCKTKVPRLLGTPIFQALRRSDDRGWRTWFFCPILWALACACRSFWGFQSLSNMMTVSAVAKFKPSPPARVDSRKQKSCEPSALKWSRACFLISPRMEPSSL